jgi:peptide/nickel transport system permease protein
MARTIVQRLLVSILVIFGAMTLVFFILHLLPGDPVQIMLAGTPASPEMVEQLRHQFGLDKPLSAQYGSYVWDAVRGNLGTSLTSNEPVIHKLMAEFPATVQLTLASTFISVVIGILLGVLSAIYHNKWIDSVVRVISLFGVSMPTFWSGILLILIFSITFRWFPATGSGSFKQLILPACALGFIGSGFIVRMVRNSMLEVISEQFILTLRSKGLSERIVMYQHALRNALIPAITMIGIQIGGLLEGAVVTETVFARQGLGRVMVDGIMSKDLPTVQGAVLFIAVILVIVNLLVDLSYTVIDPRVRRST